VAHWLVVQKSGQEQERRSVAQQLAAKQETLMARLRHELVRRAVHQGTTTVMFR
jgi:hypothetical protein